MLYLDISSYNRNQCSSVLNKNKALPGTNERRANHGRQAGRGQLKLAVWSAFRYLMPQTHCSGQRKVEITGKVREGLASTSNPHLIYISWSLAQKPPLDFLRLYKQLSQGFGHVYKMLRTTSINFLNRTANLEI